MRNIYFTGNILYLPIEPQELIAPKFYVKGTVSGAIFLNDITTTEDIQKMYKAGKLTQCDMIMPTNNPKGTFEYKRVW